MQPIQINVQVNIGLDSGLFTLLSSMVNRQAPIQEVAAVPAPGEKKPAGQQPLPEVEDTAASAPVEQPAPAKPEAAPAQEPEPQPQPQPTPAKPEAAPAQKKEYTEVDIRAAMDRTRRRIEGENYKENPDSEGYKKWHRALTGWFKNVAAACGAERPSALPDSESRARFIASCDAVYVKDGELVEDCPF